MPPMVPGTVRRHLWAMHLGGKLTQWWRNMCRPNAVRVSPRIVLKVLNRVGIRPVLIGTHALNGWRDEPRATQDVDVLVRHRQVAKATEALGKRFPKLRIKKSSTKVTFTDPAVGHEVLEIHRPVYSLCWRLFRSAIRVSQTHDVPGLEMTIVSKFALMKSPGREMSKRYLDLADTMMIIDYNRTALNLNLLEELAKLGLAERSASLLKLVDEVRSGKNTTFTKYIDEE